MTHPTMIKTTLFEGDPLESLSTDILIQTARLDVGKPVPDTWRVMTGNSFDSLIMRIVYRYELDL